MAGEQEIVTRFKADVTDLEASITKTEARLKGIEDKGVTVPITADDKKLSATLGSAAQKFTVLEATAAKSGQAIGASLATPLQEVERLAKSDLDLVKALIAEASKTPKGAEALAKQLTDVQKSALNALISMGALSKAEAQVASDAQKLINGVTATNNVYFEQIGILAQLGSRLDLLGQKRAAAQNPAQVKAVNDELIKAKDAYDRVATSITETNALTTEQVGLLGQLQSRIDVLSQQRQAAQTPEEIKAINDELEVARGKYEQIATAVTRTNTVSFEQVGILGQLAARVELLSQKRNAAQTPEDVAKINDELTKAKAKYDQIGNSTEKAVVQFVSLRTQIQQSRNNLDRLIEASGGRLTPEIRAAAAAGGQLQKRFEEVNTTINAFNPEKRFQAITGVIQNVAGGFTALQGVIALTGNQSEEVAKSLLKVQAALAITQGLQSLFGGLSSNLKTVGLLLGLTSKAQKTLVVGFGAGKVAAAGQAIATTGLSASLNAAKASAQKLYATLVANPFIAVAAAVALIVGAVIAFARETKEAVETADQLQERLDKLSRREKFAIDTTAQRQLLQNEAAFIAAQRAALRINDEDKRKSALEQAERDRERFDAMTREGALVEDLAREENDQQTRTLLRDQIIAKARLKFIEDAEAAARSTVGGREAGPEALALAERVARDEAQKTFDFREHLGKEELEDILARNKEIEAGEERILSVAEEAAQARIAAENTVSAGAFKSEEERLAFLQEASEKAKKISKDEAEERLKNQKLREGLVADIQSIIIDVDAEKAMEGLSELDLKLLETAQLFDDRIGKIQVAFAKLRKSFGEGTATPDTAAIEDLKAQELAIVTELTQVQTEAESNITRAANAQKLKEAQAFSEDVRELGLSANAKELDDIRDAFREKLDLNRKLNTELGVLTAEGLKNEADITAALNAELARVEKEQQERALADLQQALDKRTDAILSAAETIAQALGELLLRTQQDNLDRIREQSDQEIDALQEKFDRELELNREQNEGRAGLTREGADREREILAEKDAAIAAANLQRQQQEAEAQAEFRKQQRNAIIGAALDVLEAEAQIAVAQIVIKEIGSKGFLGIATGAILAAIIRGLFSALKAKLTAAHEGEALVGSKGRRPDFPGERDAYHYRLAKDERVVRAKTNRKYFPVLEAMEGGTFEKYMLSRPMATFNSYVTTDTGQRTSTSVMLAKYYDRNIVEALTRGKDEQKRTNDLLSILINRKDRGLSKRYY